MRNRVLTIAAICCCAVLVVLIYHKSSPSRLQRSDKQVARHRQESPNKETTTTISEPLAVTVVDDGVMRVLCPVRILPVLWEDKDHKTVSKRLKTELVETRHILDRFRPAGFNHAIWAVGELPGNDKDIELWTRTCLEAFPYPPIVAIDVDLTGASDKNSMDGFRIFLRSASSDTAGGAIESILVNFARLDNLSCSNKLDQAIAQIHQNVALSKDAMPDAKLWLLVSDQDGATNNVETWVAALGDSVDGFFVHRWHSWNEQKRPEKETLCSQIRKRGKPIIRAGFQYQCSRVRPGIEKDIAEYYVWRIERYEQWIADRKYAGYCREIGNSIPDEIHANRDFVLAKRTGDL